MFSRRLEGSKGERYSVLPENTSPYLWTRALRNHLEIGSSHKVSPIICRDSDADKRQLLSNGMHESSLYGRLQSRAQPERFRENGLVLRGNDLRGELEGARSSRVGEP